MAIVPGRRYVLHKPEHWRAGVYVNFAVAEDRLQAPGALGFVPVTGSGLADRAALPAFDPCGALFWLRPPGELVRHYEFGTEPAGPLLEAEGALGLAIGVDLIWVLTAGRVRRYAAETRQLLGSLAASGQRRVEAIAADGGNGLWTLEGDRGSLALRRYDAYGRRCGSEVPLPDLAFPADLAGNRTGAWLAVLAERAVDAGALNRKWSITVVDARHREEPERWDLPSGCILLCGTGRPQIAVDHGGRIHVLACAPREEAAESSSAPASPREGSGLVLLTYSRHGELIASRSLPAPDSWKPIGSLAAAERIVVVGAKGLAWILEGEPDRAGEEIVSTFITPTLVSPDDPNNRWNFGEVEARLAEGDAMEISVGTHYDPRQIDELFSRHDLARAERFEEIDRRVRWLSDRKLSYAGKPGEPAFERLRFLLDGIEQTHIWLRLRLHSLPGGAPPRIRRLTVHYPEHSYLGFLPAIYREHAGPAAQLRRFLAPVEALFDDLDERIEGLPGRIDPQSAPAEWHGFLLRWLGFPSVDSLDADVRAELLRAAPDLLAWRGTLRALQRALDILTRGHASVEDSAAGPRPWVLSPANSASGPRLGKDTLLVEAEVKALRLGATKLGVAPLDRECAEPIRLIEMRNGLITIRVGLAAAERERLEPIIRSFLAHLVPAQCRFRLIILSVEAWRARVGLDAGFRLPDDASDRPSRLSDDRGERLGHTTRLGCWRVAARSFAPPQLDGSAAIGGTRPLA